MRWLVAAAICVWAVNGVRPAARSAGAPGRRRVCRRRHVHRLPRNRGQAVVHHASRPREEARTPSGNKNQACETCHGPGKEHSETGDKAKIRVFKEMAPRDASAVCTTCHNRGAHAQWSGSMHDARNLSCVTCHSVHNAQDRPRAAQGSVSHRDVRGVPQNPGGQAAALRPHAPPRGEDGVRLPATTGTDRQTSRC